MEHYLECIFIYRFRLTSYLCYPVVLLLADYSSLQIVLQFIDFLFLFCQLVYGRKTVTSTQSTASETPTFTTVDTPLQAFHQLLTQGLVVFDLVPLATEERCGGFLEEALSRTGDVEIWWRVAAAWRQTFWTEALLDTEKWVSVQPMGKGSTNEQARQANEVETMADLCEKVVPQNVIDPGWVGLLESSRAGCLSTAWLVAKARTGWSTALHGYTGTSL